MVAFTLVGFVIWLLTFAYARYLATAELMTGAVIFILLRHLLRGREQQIASFAAVGLVTVAVVVGADAGHVRWSEHLVRDEAARHGVNTDTMVVMASNIPLAYIATAFPQQTRFARIYSPPFLGARRTRYTDSASMPRSTPIVVPCRRWVGSASTGTTSPPRGVRFAWRARFVQVDLLRSWNPT